MAENYIVKIVKHHPRLYVSMAIGFAIAFACSVLGIDSKLMSAILGFDCGAIVYIFWALHLMISSRIRCKSGP
jgi:uncharacterized membrane protein